MADVLNLKPAESRQPSAIDILHVSDAHFRATSSAADDAWIPFLEDVRGRIASEGFTPALIAFTGDLVETPGPWRGWRSATRGVHHLLELCEACGFIGKDDIPADVDTWQDLPDIWWKLVNTSLFLVPGNHDVYVKGLRCLGNRCGSIWRRLSVRPNEARPANGRRMTRCDHVLANQNLAIRLIDSNGRPGLWKLARGAYDQRLGGGESWTDAAATDGRFCIALMHGHPLQLPFHLTGLFEGEASMMVENSGLLLKHLGQLRVRLVLHGHRHYPGQWNLTLPDAEGKPHPIVVVSAGSVTSPPSRWPHYSYNWVRLYQDRRVKVMTVERAKHEPRFAPALRVFDADRGDFKFDRVEKSVVVTQAGDVDVLIRVVGLRVAPGRPSIASIPFKITLEPHAKLAAFRVSSKTEQGKANTDVAWDRRSRLVFAQPFTAQHPAADITIRYFLHNAVATNTWEAEQLQGVSRSEEWTSHLLSCETGEMSLSVMPPVQADTFDVRRHARIVIMDERGKEDVALGEHLTSAIQWDPKDRRLTFASRHVRTDRRVALRWTVGDLPAVPVTVNRVRHRIRQWNREVYDKRTDATLPLTSWCTRVATAVGDQWPELAKCVVSMWVPFTSGDSLTGEGVLPGSEPSLASLGLVGQWPPTESKVPRTLPFGRGVAGRALRLGAAIRYLAADASQTTVNFGMDPEQTDVVAKHPQNYYEPWEDKDEPRHQAVLAIPVFPIEALADFPAGIGDARLVALVVCLAASGPGHPLVSLGEDDCRSVVQTLARDVETQLWKHLGAGAR